MKKYIFNLNADVLNNETLDNVKGLAVFIAIYNAQQPGVDFKNFLDNKLPYMFTYEGKGYLTTRNGEPNAYNVYEQKMGSYIGEIEIFNVD